MECKFVSYKVADDGIDLQFSTTEMGPATPTEYTIRLSDAELAGISTTIQLRDLCIAKLQRKLLRQGIASKLDPLLGQTVTA